MAERIFIVGSPRSGTTLLQSLLAAHNLIASFPESHFFPNLIPHQKLLKILGFASKNARYRLKQFLSEIKHEEMNRYLDKWLFFIKQYIEVFLKILDELTLDQDKRLWIEKTPRHLRYIEFIEKYIADPKFIHIIRNGADVVASLYDVTHKYPEIWGGSRDIDQCIKRWGEDVNISMTHLYHSNHFFVRYEKLVQNPKTTLKKLCGFIGIPFRSDMLENFREVSKDVVLNGEYWKFSINKPIQNANSRKFHVIFNKSQKEYILDKVSYIDLSEFGLE